MSLVVLALTAAACGGDEVVYEQVPGGAPPLTVPQGTEDGALGAPDVDGDTTTDDGADTTTEPGTDPDATTTDDGTVAPPVTGTTGTTAPPAAGTAEPAVPAPEPATPGGAGTGTTGTTGDSGATGGDTGGAGATGETGGTSQGGTEAPPATDGAESGAVAPDRFEAFCERNVGACVQ